MNNEAYAEWLVKRKTPAYAWALKALMIGICVIAVLLALSTMFGIVILFAAGAAAYFLFRNLSVEYEYLYVSGQLTIDKILGRAKRKKAWEGMMEEIQIIAPADSYLLKEYENHDMKTLDFSSQTQAAKVYVLISRSGSETVKILFEPNDKMLHCFKMTSPRKVVQ